MDTVVNLTDGGAKREVFTSTEVDGRLRTGKLLSEVPLSSYLEGEEEAKYALRNKKSGVTVEEGSDSTEITPGSEFQALALVTDVRVLFVVGMRDGDRTESVTHSDMVQAKSADDGFRTTLLVIETINGRRWSFPCTGDTAEVASFVDGLAQVWANAERLADEAEESLEAASQHIDADEYEAAAESLADVKPNLETAVERLTEVGEGAGAHIRDRAETLARRYHRLERPIRAQLAASAHAEGMTAWREEDFERAARRYEAAIDGYRQALERESGSENERLRRRLRSALRERELLCVSPLVEADTARRRTQEVEEPEAAAANWRDVLDRYQGLLDLEWPSDRGFVAQTEAVHTQAAAAAEDAVEDYYEAGKRRLGSADRFAVDGREERATVLYERAHEQFERASRLAEEASPERLDDLEAALETVEERLEGNRPSEALPVDELSITAREAESNSDSEEEADPETTAGVGGGTSVIGRIQSQKQEESGDGSPGSVGRGTGEAAGDGVTNTELRAELRKLDDPEFTQLVADLWEAQGWSTTVFAAARQVVYDIVAMREAPEEQRLLLWTEHRAEDEQLGPRAVERCATARDSSHGADSATLVTNALPRTAAEQRAEGLEVTVIDGRDLVELLRFEGFLDRLDWDAPNA
jgi:molybdenum-dependent DNA-binding transcriptional regulator ModE